jgi:ferredoxin
MVGMTWQLKVDEKMCMTTGMCAGLAPELFDLGNTYAVPLKPEIEPDDRALDAADQCPAQAISVVENGVEIGPRP